MPVVCLSRLLPRLELVFILLLLQAAFRQCMLGASLAFVMPQLMCPPSCRVKLQHSGYCHRHNTHASLIQQALTAGKHVFVEKPFVLLLKSSQLFRMPTLVIISDGWLQCRFAPLLLELRNELQRCRGPKAFVYTINAGVIPSDHWTQDPSIGGGRLLGEACHFVDLLFHLASSSIEDLKFLSVADTKPCPDTFSLQLRFADGSIGTVHYFSNGSRAFPKERLEVFTDGKVLRLDNFRKLQAWGIPGFRTRRLFSQDKDKLAAQHSFPPSKPVDLIRYLLRSCLQSRGGFWRPWIHDYLLCSWTRLYRLANSCCSCSRWSSCCWC